jgi:hypothetical protein
MSLSSYAVLLQLPKEEQECFEFLIKEGPGFQRFVEEYAEFWRASLNLHPHKDCRRLVFERALRLSATNGLDLSFGSRLPIAFALHLSDRAEQQLLEWEAKKELSYE